MEEKNLHSLLQSSRVVPEIQREYVWGHNEQVLISFLENLNDKKSGSASNVGFLYSYNSEGEYHLIDGQQRFTTLVLLALYCARKEKKPVNEYESILNKFSYRVRTATDEYLKNLLADESLNHFSEEVLGKKKYCHISGNEDPSTSSMIAALQTIDRFRRTKGDDFAITFDSVMCDVKFWTFDVENTTQGEELYISMNSRGENLLGYENIKPLLLEKAGNSRSAKGETWGKAWDNWEDCLFVHTKDVKKVNLAMERLILMAIQLSTAVPRTEINAKEDIHSITIQQVEEYFESFFRVLSVFKTETDTIFEEKYETSAQQMLEALISAASHLATSDDELKDVRHLINVWQIRSLIDGNKKKKYLEFLKGYRASEKSFKEFVIEQYEKDKDSIAGISDGHEVFKMKLWDNVEIKTAFIEADDFHVTHGYLGGIWNEAFSDVAIWNEPSTFETFNRRYRTFTGLFAKENVKVKTSAPIEKDKIDNRLIAKALIAMNVGNYHSWTSGRNYAFGYNTEWYRILQRPEKAVYVSKLIDRLVSKDNIFSELNAIIEEGKSKFEKNDARYYILNYEESLNADNEGYNILFMDNCSDWTNFNIAVYDKYTGHSHYHDMMSALVFNRLPEDIKSETDEWLTVPSKGISVRISSLRGWNIHWHETKDSEIDSLYSCFSKNTFGTEMSEKMRAQRYFHIQLQEGEEQIELGLKVMKLIHDFKPEAKN